MSSAISIRPTDSDDVKWALHTASTQMERGSLADAIQWVKRAAQYAEESGDAWRATELKNSARELAEQMWTSEPEPANPLSVPPSSTIEISVEDVEADDLLEGGSPSGAPAQYPPDAYQPGLYQGGFQSVPPGTVMRQSYPADSAPPEPIPLYPVGGNPPSGWSPQAAFPQQSSHFATSAMPVPAASPGGFAPVNAVSSPASTFTTKAPTLQFGTPQGSEAPGQRPPPPRRRSIRPKAPQRSSSNPPPPHRSSSPAGSPPGGPEVFSSAPPTDRFSARPDQRAALAVNRGPLGSAPELLVSELDLEGAAYATSSLLPPPPTEPELTPEEFERDLRAHDDNDVVSSAPFDVDPALADLFAEEEVVEDRDSVDRMSDVMLDASEFEHQSLVDDQEETHVLTKNVVQSLKDAARRPPPPPASESGEHEAVSQSAFPTAPPPGAMPPSSQAQRPSAGGRTPSADMRRVVPPASAPPVPFQPAPSSPHASGSASVPPSSFPPPMPQRSVSPTSAPPLYAPPMSHVPSPPALAAAPPTSAAAHASSTAATHPSMPAAPPASSIPPSAPASPRSAPPLLVRRSSRAAPAEAITGRPGDAGAGPASTSPTVNPHAPASRGEPPSLGTPTSLASPRTLDALSLTSLPPSAAPPPTSIRRSSAAPAASSAPASPKPELLDPFVDGANLAEARGFEDLPEEVQLALASSARVERLSAGEEVSFFGAAIVTSGRVDILPAFSEEAGAVADEGDVIFTHGNLEGSIDLRVVAKLDDTRVGVWDPETLRGAIAECPWVADELKLIADRYLALCGATLGPLGERLDDSLRATVFQRLEVRVYNEGDVLAEIGKPIPGLLIVGGGRVLVRDANGEQTGELNMGDFVFASGLLGGAKAPGTAFAAKGGALVLTAPRQVAHELMMSVPPLVEVLAG